MNFGGLTLSRLALRQTSLLSRSGVATAARQRRKTVPAVMVAAACYIAYRQYDRVKEREAARIGFAAPWPSWKIRLYCALPTRSMSRVNGWLAERELPRSLRRPLLGLFAWCYSCRLDDLEQPDLREYRNLADFFARPLNAQTRPISATCLVSPADGTVLRCSQVKNDCVDQVKGSSFHLRDFFGPNVAYSPTNKSLYYCVIYLAPKDYHGIHSPADWSAHFRRHFNGLLLSVRERQLRRVPRLLCRNERVLLTGRWAHGFFSLTAVGATNVGHIRLADDAVAVRTNARGAALDGLSDGRLARTWRCGERVGEFRLGSTVVLVFEAPPNFTFAVNPGDGVKYGQSLGFIDERSR